MEGLTYILTCAAVVLFGALVITIHAYVKQRYELRKWVHTAFEIEACNIAAGKMYHDMKVGARHKYLPEDFSYMVDMMEDNDKFQAAAQKAHDGLISAAHKARGKA